MSHEVMLRPPEAQRAQVGTGGLPTTMSAPSNSEIPLLSTLPLTRPKQGAVENACSRTSFLTNFAWCTSV
eukprot:2796704-Pyramimonas_sp.AAC.1